LLCRVPEIASSDTKVALAGTNIVLSHIRVALQGTKNYVLRHQYILAPLKLRCATFAVAGNFDAAVFNCSGAATGVGGWKHDGRSCWRSAAQYPEQLLREEVSVAAAEAAARRDRPERTGRCCGWRRRSARRRPEQLLEVGTWRPEQERRDRVDPVELSGDSPPGRTEQDPKLRSLAGLARFVV
jgi:hypothetical protein